MFLRVLANQRGAWTALVLLQVFHTILVAAKNVLPWTQQTVAWLRWNLGRGCSEPGKGEEDLVDTED